MGTKRKKKLMVNNKMNIYNNGKMYFFFLFFPLWKIVKKINNIYVERVSRRTRKERKRTHTHKFYFFYFLNK